MAHITSVAPVLLVRDVVAAAEHYRDRLGFTFERFWGDPPDFCMVKRDGIIVMLSQVPPQTQVVPHWKVVHQLWSAYFWVDDADVLHDEFVRRGATIDYGLSDKPYGIREFGVQDLDGHDLGFGQPL
ncbi:MAG TPA: VOC family protein [Longimicrobiaceae bacterium]